MARYLLLIVVISGAACGGNEGGGISYADAGFIDRNARDAGPCPDEGFSRAEDGRCLCNNDLACGSGSVCEGGQCLDGCRHDGHCQDTEQCEVQGNNPFGVCVSVCPNGDCPDSCGNDSDCPDGQHCAGRFCAPNCQSNTECAQGEACVASGRCIQGCLSAEDCGGRATCEEAQCTCEPAQAFTVVEVEDQTANAGLRSGDNLSVTIHVPNVDRDLQVGLILRTQNVSRVDFANAQWQGMEHDGNGFRELRSGGHGAIVTFTGLDSSVTLSAVAGASRAPVRVDTELVMLGQQGQECAAVVPNSKGLANLPVVGAASDLANCADMHGAYMVQVMTAQAPVAISEFDGRARDDMSWAGQDVPLVGPMLHYCIDLLGSGDLALSSDWRGEAPVAVQGQLLFEAFDMAQTEVCQNAGDCTRPGVQSCIDGQCRERIAIRMAGASERPLRDREHRNAEVETTGPESCLDTCAVAPVPRNNPAWGAGDLNLTGFLRWGQRTDLRMSVLATGDQVANSALFLQTRELPEWWLSKTCRCDFGSGAMTCGAPSDQGLDAARRICSED